MTCEITRIDLLSFVYARVLHIIFPDGKASRTARFSAATLSKLGIAAGDRVRVRQGEGEAILAVALDAGLADNTVRIARGVAETAALGEGEISIERIR
ncbi:MAG TPA: hypothetical protein VIV66_11970, partial [Pyrinomonadaceae bacterium]